MPKTLIILLVSSIIFTCQVGCKFGKESKKNAIKEFEGVITYHEILKDNEGTFNLDDTVKVFYSHGNYVGLHSAKSSGFHVVKDYYFENKPLRLLLFNTSDTLHEIALNSPVERLDGFKIKKIDDQIFSRKCENIEVNASYPEKGSITYTDFSFIFSREYLKIDKQHFKNWNLGFFNKVTSESGVYFLKFKAVHFDSSHRNILSSKTYDVISVKEEAVDPGMFEIDSKMIERAK